VKRKGGMKDGQGGNPSACQANLRRTEAELAGTTSHPVEPKVFYVGETGKTFATRMADHLRLQLSGMYRIYEPEKFSRGEKELVWAGMFGPDGTKRASEFVERLDEIALPLAGFVRGMRFCLAPLALDKPVRQWVERAIKDRLEAGGRWVQDPGINYRKNRPVGLPPISIVVTPGAFGLAEPITA